ncbi:MAG: cupin domain-containing protein, partial [Nocardioides sp.]
GGTRFTALAAPSTGSTENSLWTVEIDPGTPASPHSLTREEVFTVLAGVAQVSLAGETSTARAGDAIVVPAGVEFGLANPGPDTLRLVCCLPVGGQATMGGATFTPPWAE